MRRLRAPKRGPFNDKYVGRHRMRRPPAGHRNVHNHGAESYMTRRLRTKRRTYTATLRRGNRVPIPWHPPGWRIGMRLFFKLRAYQAVQVSPNPKGALLHGRFQSSRIRSAYPNAIANRHFCNRTYQACLPTETGCEAPTARETTANNLKEANDD